MISSSLQLMIGLFASYLLGSIPFGLLVARVRGVDIRRVGSGNIGATNVFRAVGKGWGILTFLLDFLKGFLPTVGLPLLLNYGSTGPAPTWAGLAGGCLAIAGHTWPIFLKFKGGKGVATSAGMLAGVAPLAVVIALCGWMLVAFSTGYVSLASITAGLLIAASAWVLYFGRGPLLPSVLTLLAILVIFRHRNNIKRLLNGTENRFGKRRKS